VTNGQKYNFYPKYHNLVPKIAILSQFFVTKHNLFVLLEIGSNFAAETDKGYRVMRKITALGDSIMRGVILDKSSSASKPRYTNLSDNFASICATELGVDIKNFGRFGNTTLHALKSWERYKTDIADSDYIVIEFGGNDCDHNWLEIANNPAAEHHPIVDLPKYVELLRTMIINIKELNSQPLLLSLPPIIADSYFNAFTKNMNTEQKNNVLLWLNGCLENITQWHEMYNLELFKLSTELDVPIIDITSPFLVKRNYRNLFCDDGIHPNKKGHSLIADTICHYAHRFI